MAKPWDRDIGPVTKRAIRTEGELEARTFELNQRLIDAHYAEAKRYADQEYSRLTSRS